MSEHPKPHRDLTKVPDELWQVARERERVIRPLVLEPPAYGARVEQMAAAAETLGITPQYLYRLVKAYEADPRTQSLLPKAAGRKTGMRRLDPRVEAIIEEEIQTNSPKLLKPKKSALMKGIHARCKAECLPKPARETVDLRLAAISKRKQTKRRHGAKRARDEYAPVWGSLEAERPLQIVQIDHTPCDIMAIEPETWEVHPDGDGPPAADHADRYPPSVQHP